MLITDCKLKSYEERLFNIFYSAIAAINTDPELYKLLRTAFCTVKFVNRNRTRYIACEMPRNYMQKERELSERKIKIIRFHHFQ